jgi:hypothetical protein
MRVYPHDGLSSAIRITRSTIVFITRGRPGPGRRLYVHLSAISFRYQRNRVSGVTRVSSSLNSLRPSACAFRASRQRSVSVKRRCFPPRRALSTRFSSCRYAMTSSCWASLQHAATQYLTHYHGERNHQGLEDRLLKPYRTVGEVHAPVKRRERLGGMLNYYHREAA